MWVGAIQPRGGGGYIYVGPVILERRCCGGINTKGYEAGCSALGLGSICLTPLFPGVVGRINRL